MEMREASNGGASGRVCADAARKFPENQISAANPNAIFNHTFLRIAKFSTVLLRQSTNSGKAYFYTLIAAFQIEIHGCASDNWTSPGSLPRASNPLSCMDGS